MKIFEIITEAIASETIDLVKGLWDNGIHSANKIANELGLSVSQVKFILSRYYQDRVRKRETYSPEFIQQVKDLWDSTHSPRIIASNLGITVKSVNGILDHYYIDRFGKRETYSSELIQQVKDLWDSGMHSRSKIANELGLSVKQVEFILTMHYRDRPGKQDKGSVPKDQIPSIISMYKNGQSLNSIINLLNINATDTGIKHALKKLSDWEEIRAEHLANRTPITHKAVTTKKTRPGEIGNNKSQGPNNRNSVGTSIQARLK